MSTTGGWTRPVLAQPSAADAAPNEPEAVPGPSPDEEQGSASANALAEAPPASETQAPDASLAAQLELSQARLRSAEEAIEGLKASQEAQAETLAVEELAASLSGSGAVEEELLRIYGFSEVGLRYIRVKSPKNPLYGIIGPSAPTFVLGSFNLYLDANPSENWRALTELHMGFFPLGEELSFDGPGTTYSRIDTGVFDQSSATGRARVYWSGVVLERAWIQWTPKDWFQARVGYFLTPYGIWNIDHGAPALIAQVLPDFFAVEYFPTRQLGLQLLGAVVQGAWEYGYHAYVTNGRTPTQVDVTADKAFGGRIFARRARPSRLVLGASFYRGSFYDFRKRIDLSDGFGVVPEFTVRGTESAVSFDIAYDKKAWQFRFEAASSRKVYEEGRREPVLGGAPGTFVPDGVRCNAYGILAYNLPWFHRMFKPFTMVELLRRPNGTTSGNAQIAGGLNIQFTPSVSLKTQYSAYRLFDWGETNFRDQSSRNLTLHAAQSRLMLVF